MFNQTVTVETTELAKAISLLATNNLKPENVRAIKDSEGNVHCVQLGLFSYTQKCNAMGITNTQVLDHTRINLISGQYLVVALKPSEVAKALGFQLDE
ncbi:MULTISPECIES: hypothetical protein [Vibrio]|uniref:Uncharacterized protein n=1 Tax=Vibrio lentus TaxID=136468 RepID=A0A2N7K4V1_9VIBR|nr:MULTISPECIES: hypothetical protein [Vibrio]PMM69304.1 hypothetical protein BCT49_07250 [Vibrio lentus]TCT62839.1 hypothetical protein EDB31_13553 [Vibrio crassostreae]